MFFIAIIGYLLGVTDIYVGVSEGGKARIIESQNLNV
jgi:hypothetical protein